MCSLQVPCLPFLPLLSISISAVLMARLSAAAWLRYLLWMAVGKHGHSPGPRAGTSPSGCSSGGLRTCGTNAALSSGGEGGDADLGCPAVVGAPCPLICAQRGQHLVAGRGRKRNSPYTPYFALSQVSSFTLAMGSGTALRASGLKGQVPGSCWEAEPGRYPWSPVGLPCAHLLQGKKRGWLVPECLAPSILCPGGKEAPWAVGPVPQRGPALPELQELIPQAW